MTENIMHPKKVFSRIGLALFLYLITVNVVYLAFNYVCAAYLEGFYSSRYYTLLSSAVVQYGVGLPVCALILHKLPNYRYKGQKLRAVNFLGCLALLSACSYAGSIAGNAINSFLGFVLNKDMTDPVDELIMNSPIWLLFAVVVVIGPIVEELIFRRFIIDKVRPYGELLAVVFSGMVFGAFHGNISQFFYAALVGFVLGYIYLRTMKLKYTALLHILFNFIFGFIPAVIQKYFPLADEVLMRPSIADLPALLVNSGYGVLVLGSAVLGIVYFFLKKKSVTFYANYYEIPKGQRFKFSVLNGGMIAFGIFCLLEFLLYIFM